MTKQELLDQVEDAEGLLNDLLATKAARNPEGIDEEIAEARAAMIAAREEYKAAA